MPLRLTRILTDADTDLAELWMALFVATFGLAVANPFASIYGAGPAFRALQTLHIAEWFYGGITALAGITHLCVILHRRYLWRLVAACFQTAGCAGTGAMLWYGNPHGYGWVMFTVAMGMGLIIVNRLAALVETARYWGVPQEAVWAERTTGG